MSWGANFEDFGRPSMRKGGTSDTQTGLVAGVASRGSAQGQEGDVRGIAELIPGMSNSKIVGVIIAKGEPKHFLSKKDCSSERFVFTFTLRDSPSDFINVSCWGSEQHITTLASQFHIGEVVQLDQASIQTKATDGSDEKFKPWTPSLYHLSLNEARGSLTAYVSWNTNEYLRLLRVPVKASNDFYTISDIINNGPALNGEVISILAVVKQVKGVKHMKSKSGRHLQRCDITLFDDTAPDFTMVLWDEELINLTQSWIPRENIIFAADIRVTYDDWKKTMIATAIAKSVITVNPDTREAHNLYQYSQSVDFGCETFEVTAGESDRVMPLNEIHTIYKIEQLKGPYTWKDSESSVLYGIVYAYLSLFNIDDSVSSVISTRCSRCHYRLDKDSFMCTNENCPPPTNAQLPEFNKCFDIRVSITDETGTLPNCLLAGDAAQRMLGCSVDEFLSLSDDQRTELKWKFLLEKCKLYLKVSLHPHVKKQFRTRILQCEVADIKESVGSFMESC